MVRYYYDNTQDIELLREAVSALDIEYIYWMTTQSVTMPDGHVLNRYYSRYKTPRPESYREDVTNSEGMTAPEADHFYSNIIAGAESGEDFSTKWFTEGSGLTSISTSSFLPVGLNSILYKFEANMVYFYEQLGMTPPVDYGTAMLRRRAAMDEYLWNEEDFQWHDFCLNNGSQIIRSYPSNWLPIWAGAYNANYSIQLYNSFVNSNLVQVGGILTTLYNSSQQWDSPNAWAPYQSFLAQALLYLGTPQSIQLAKTIASRWVNATYIGYQNTQMMHEKYNAFIPGAPGQGGEYPPQIGFGWTNGVSLEFLKMFFSNTNRNDNILNY